MLQLAFIRQNAELVKERLALRNFAEMDLVDKIVGLDDQRKRLQFESDTVQSKLNAQAKEIGLLMAKGQKDNADAQRREVAGLKAIASSRSPNN